MNVDSRSSAPALPAVKCCGRAGDPATGRVALDCGKCGTVTCGLHAYVGSRGEWRCAGCFGELPAPADRLAIALPGRVPAPLGGTAHVVLVLHGLHICGAARHCLELLDVFNAKRIHTTVVALQGGGQWGERFLNHTNDLRVYSSPSADGRELSELPWRAERRIVSAHYDPAIAWAMASPVAAEYIAHFHTEPEFGLFTRATLLAAGARSRWVFFPSATTRASYRAMLHGPPPDWWDERCVVLPNANPAQTLQDAAAPAEPTVDQLANLGIISRIDPDKLSIQLLVETVDTLRRLVPALRVRVAGDGVVRPQLERALARRGLTDCVELLGWVDDIAPVYTWSGATFLPSHSETMPYAVIESTGFGRPVVVPALGYFAEERATGPLIHTFEPGNPESAVQAILAALAPGSRDRADAFAPVDGQFHAARWRHQVLARYGLSGKPRLGAR